MAFSGIPPILSPSDDAVEPTNSIPGRNQEAELPRLPFTWAVFALLFVFLIAMGLGGVRQAKAEKYQSPAEVRLENQKRSLEMSIRSQFASSALLPGERRNTQGLETLISDLEPLAKSSSEYQALRVVLRHEAGTEPFRGDLEKLALTTNSKYTLLAELYSPKRSKIWSESDKKLISQFSGNKLFEQIATVQLAEAAGNTTIRATTFPAKWFIVAALALFAAGGLSLCGLVLCFTFFSSGASASAGHPSETPANPLSGPLSDRQILFAITLIATFLVSGLVVASLGAASFSLQAGLVSIAFVVAIIALFLRIGVAGWNVTVERLFGGKISLKRLIGFVLGGAAATWVGMMVALAIVWILQDKLGQGSHPVSAELTSNPSGWKLAGIFFGACVVAPFWEEIVFRGLIFPAFSQVTKSPIWGALITTFCFTAIHPQGSLGLIILAPISLSLCAVTYYSRSLWPAIVLHALNNCMVLTASLLVDKIGLL